MGTQQLTKYVIVGGIGFIIDGGLFSALVASHLNPYESRAISFTAAVSVTWILNRRFTFDTAPPEARRVESPLAIYIWVQLLGALLNLSIFFLLELLNPLPNLPEITYLALGSLISMFATYYLSSKKVFN